jgi:hypothetical protein
VATFDGDAAIAGVSGKGGAEFFHARIVRAGDQRRFEHEESLRRGTPQCVTA